MAARPAVCFVVATLLATFASAAPPGVVVEDMGSAGTVLAVGDTLLTWERSNGPEPSAGAFGSAFDLAAVSLLEAPLGEVVLTGQRDGKPFVAAMPPIRWHLAVRPWLGDSDLARLRDAASDCSVGQAEAGAAALRRLSRDASARGDDLLAAWLGAEAGQCLTTAERAARATPHCEQALTAAAQLGEPMQAAFAMFHCAAEVRWLPAMAALQAVSWPDGLLEAELLYRLTASARSAGRLDRATAASERAAALRARLAPGSYDSALSFQQLGTLYRRAGDLQRAEATQQRALALFERIAPESLAVAQCLGNLGVAVRSRGDLEAAESYQRRALAIKERLVPDSLDLARTVGNLGVIAMDRGDYAQAEEDLNRALAILERLAPDGPERVAVVDNLGLVASDRGDPATAERLHRQALAQRERTAPASFETATSITNLAGAVGELGKLDEASGLYDRAEAIFAGQAPRSIALAHLLVDRATLLREAGQEGKAAEVLTRSLGILETEAPRSVATAHCLLGLGELATAAGRLDEAALQLTAALDVCTTWAPGSDLQARVYRALATLARQRGQLELECEHLLAAVTALEQQVGRLGGSQLTRARYRAMHRQYYFELIAVLLRLGRTEEAFQVLERSRARELLNILAERDLVFTADVPEPLDRQRRQIAAEVDVALDRLASVSEQADAAERDALLARVDQLRQEQEQIREAVRAASPRLAALQYPQPLTAASARQLLDDGALLLAYAVGEKQSVLFVMRSGDEAVRAYTLPLGSAALARHVERFRRLVLRGLLKPSVRGVHRRGEELSHLLLAPARREIVAAKRLVILPDGPLHLLPFAAIADPTAKGDWRYLVEDRSVVVVASATALAESRRSVRPHREERVAVLADPTVDARSPWAAGLVPLPSARLEAQGLADLYSGSVEVWLGKDASEARATAIGPAATDVHIAAHALTDELMPLESGLVLAADAGDNGLLQAWEVFEKVRMDADLVTLSACDTGLGEELGGEGVVGLTRAFQYAGARSVLASLWSVADESTAELMRAFYGRLRAGRPRDEALREAQLELLRRPRRVDGDLVDLSHPVHWAGFFLVGDWR